MAKKQPIYLLDFVEHRVIEVEPDPDNPIYRKLLEDLEKQQYGYGGGPPPRLPDDPRDA